METTVLAVLEQHMRVLCHAPDLALAPETVLHEIPGIDSLRLLQAIAHLEDHFQVEIDVAALESPSCVGDILDAITAARPVA